MNTQISVLDRVRLVLAELTSKTRKVADFVLANPQEAVFFTT